MSMYIYNGKGMYAEWVCHGIPMCLYHRHTSALTTQHNRNALPRFDLSEKHHSYFRFAGSNLLQEYNEFSQSIFIDNNHDNSK